MIGLLPFTIAIRRKWIELERGHELDWSQIFRPMRYIERGEFKNRGAIDEPWFDETREFKQLRLLRQIKRRLKHNLRSSDYFAIISFCPHSILLTNYAKSENWVYQLRHW